MEGEGGGAKKKTFEIAFFIHRPTDPTASFSKSHLRPPHVNIRRLTRSFLPRAFIIAIHTIFTFTNPRDPPPFPPPFLALHLLY